jgi:hypothetical protein
MKKPKKVIVGEKKDPPIRTSIVAPTEQLGIVSVSHFQSVKQSIDYQSADAGYTLRINCIDDPKVIRKAIRRAERIVESALVDKVEQQQQLLRALAEKNRK